MSDRTNPRFQFSIDVLDGKLAPESVSATELGAVIAQIEKAVIESAKAKGLELQDEEIVSLVGVEPGSDRLTFAASARLVALVAGISTAVATGEYSGLAPGAHEALSDLSRQAIHHARTYEFREESRLGIRSAVISAECPVPKLTARKPMHGTTTITGRCIQVGGVMPRAKIRLTTGTLLLVAVTENQAKQLAKRLYELVSLDGEATWNSSDWKIQSFVTKRVRLLSQNDPVSSFERLAAAANGRWAEVDAQKFVRELRSERHDK